MCVQGLPAGGPPKDWSRMLCFIGGGGGFPNKPVPPSPPNPNDDRQKTADNSKVSEVEKE